MMAGGPMVPLFTFLELTGAPTLSAAARALYDRGGYLWANLAREAETFAFAGASPAWELRAYKRLASEGGAPGLSIPAPLPAWGAIAETQPDLPGFSTSIFEALDDCCLGLVDNDCEDSPLARVFVQAFAAGYTSPTERVPGPWGMADQNGKGYAVKAVAIADLYIREAEARQVETTWGAPVGAIDAPTPSTLRRLPQWASWEAFADALDTTHRDFAPELAAAFWVWAKVCRAASNARRVNLTTPDYSNKVNEAWLAVHWTKTAPLLRPADVDRIAKVANPEPKIGGRKTGSKTKVVDARKR